MRMTSSALNSTFSVVERPREKTYAAPKPSTVQPTTVSPATTNELMMFGRIE